MYYLLLLNLPFFALNFIFFIALPLLLRKHYIIEETLASLIKFFFLFCSQLLSVPIAKNIQLHSKKLNNSSSMSRFLLSSLFYAWFKTTTFILHLMLFRLSIVQSQCFTFAILFSFFFILLFSLYLPQTIAKQNLSNKKSTKVLLVSAFRESFACFASHPFFTSFLFFHSLFLLILSPFTLFIYPSVPHILYNLNIAYEMLSAKQSERKFWQ